MIVERLTIPVAHGERSASLAATVRRNEGDDWTIFVHGWGCSRDSFAEAFERSELEGRNL